ncbi:MAG: anti-sigma factor antagonist [Xanthomonadaceae bacterium]|nr:anti-sigma factor antagonist [Xanthomonadaceae bacterium]
MPSADHASVPASLRRDGDVLRINGDLGVNTVAALWAPALAQLAGVRRLDTRGVLVVDSSGVALLAELAARAGAATIIEGDPPGLGALRAAYRLTPGLDYSA